MPENEKYKIQDCDFFCNEEHSWGRIQRELSVTWITYFLSWVGTYCILLYIILYVLNTL